MELKVVEMGYGGFHKIRKEEALQGKEPAITASGTSDAGSTSRDVQN